MGVTISTHNGSKVCREHNMRNEKVVSKEEHIDPNGHFEIWHDEKLADAYQRIFGNALAEYNAKQKRADRRIDDYLKHVRADDNRHEVYEMIVAIGNSKGEQVSEEESRKALHTFVYGDDLNLSWQERNPNLEIVGCYYHADEKGVPHVHIDYVPVAHGYKRGMETQNGLVKAFEEMGLEKQGKATAQIQWEQRENKTLERLVQSMGYSVEHPKENREHMHTKEYKQAQNELAKLEKQVIAENKFLAEYEKDTANALERLSEAQIRLEKVKGDLKDLEAQKTQIKGEIEVLQKEKTEMAQLVSAEETNHAINSLNKLVKDFEKVARQVPDSAMHWEEDLPRWLEPQKSVLGNKIVGYNIKAENIKHLWKLYDHAHDVTRTRMDTTNGMYKAPTYTKLGLLLEQSKQVLAECHNTLSGQNIQALRDELQLQEYKLKSKDNELVSQKRQNQDLSRDLQATKRENQKLKHFMDEVKYKDGHSVLEDFQEAQRQSRNIGRER